MKYENMRPNTLHWIYTAINSAYLMRSEKLEINFIAILLKQGYKWRILYMARAIYTSSLSPSFFFFLPLSYCFSISVWNNYFKIVFNTQIADDE